MKKFKTRLFSQLPAIIALLFAFIISAGIHAETYKYSDNIGKQGFNLVQSRTQNVTVTYSVTEFNLGLMDINGESMHVLNLPNVFLPNDEGAPNVPGHGRYIAIPQGATPVLKIISVRKETFTNINLSPAPRIPLDTDDSPLVYKKDPAIYSQNAFYPAEPIKISEPSKIRGVDVVILGITPFQYNPVTKELVVFRDIEVEIEFVGGNGHFGEDRLRSRWWDPILEDALLNHSILPKIDYNRIYQSGNRSREECEYLIISPNSADYQQWADSIKKFRNEQGILTNVITLTEIGGNTTSAIEAYINNAYNNWSVSLVACLLLGDYGTDASINVIAPMYSGSIASDNIYADVDNDHLPDVTFARITANNPDQVETMVTKFIYNERNPPTNFHYYGHPITALGWQTSRWFQICAESIGGFWKNELNKSVERINAIYNGNPSVDPWSTAQNTSTILNVFGPNGLNYIPATPSQLGGWTGGNSTQINNSINSGAFMILHRDHGSTTSWGEPYYNTSHINSLDNEDLVFVFSINCLTGKYNMPGECFAEKFHRHTKNGHNAGALGVIAASETSYSFVNDTYVWGMFDNMWPDFMPDYGTTPDSRDVCPAFGNSAGKYFLQQSSWPYNTGNKEVTYYLFHHHGGAFLNVYYSLPENLTVVHDTVIQPGATTFTITTTAGAFIALTKDGEILSTATGGLGAITMTIPPLQIGDEVLVTVTKQNYYRYSKIVPVQDILIAGFTSDTTMVCEGGSVDFIDETIGNVTSWLWTFEGGDPSTSAEQNPTGIIYETPGTYDVTLEVTNQYSNHSITKENYITVNEYLEASITITPEQEEICEGDSVMFTATYENEGYNPTFQWMVNGVAVGDNNDTIYISNMVDQDEITCEMTSSEPCLVENPVMSNAVVMTVHEYVAVSITIETASTEICSGEEITFTAIPENPGDNPTYTWTVNGIITGDNSNTFITTELIDQDEVMCELNSSEYCTTGNPANSNTIVMTVHENIDVSVSVTVSTNNICEGDEVTFTATPVNPGVTPTYQWKVNGVEAGDNNPAFTTSTMADQDVVICELYSSEFCPSEYPAISNEIIMIVQMLPLQPDTPEGPDQVDTYLTPTSIYTTSLDPEATAYNWEIAPANAGTMNIQDNSCTVTWDQGFVGTASIKVSCSNDCGDGPFSYNFDVAVENTFGIEDYLNAIGIKVFPNPNNGNFTILLNSEKPVAVNFRIVSALGEIIFERHDININGEYRKVFDLSNNAEGIYFFMIENNNSAIHKRIIIQR